LAVGGRYGGASAATQSWLSPNVAALQRTSPAEYS
jgi:hypothetical protein